MQRVHNEQWEIVRAQTSIVWDHDGPGSAELCRGSCDRETMDASTAQQARFTMIRNSTDLAGCNVATLQLANTESIMI